MCDQDAAVDAVFGLNAPLLPQPLCLLPPPLHPSLLLSSPSLPPSFAPSDTTRSQQSPGRPCGHTGTLIFIPPPLPPSPSLSLSLSLALPRSLSLCLSLALPLTPAPLLDPETRACLSFFPRAPTLYTLPLFALARRELFPTPLFFCSHVPVHVHVPVPVHVPRPCAAWYLVPPLSLVPKQWPACLMSTTS